MKFCRSYIIILFYIHVLLGILVRFPDGVYILYHYLLETIGDCDKLDLDLDMEIVIDVVIERERQSELKNTIDEKEKNLKKARFFYI